MVLLVLNRNETIKGEFTVPVKRFDSKYTVKLSILSLVFGGAKVWIWFAISDFCAGILVPCDGVDTVDSLRCET